jgi:hypothetical protein
VSFSTTFTDKLVSISLYTAMIFLTVWAGTKIINKTLDQLFISSFIRGWEQVVITLQEKQPIFPAMKNKQLVPGMKKIEQLAKKNLIDLPHTNTSYSFAHVLKKLNQPEQHIFLIAEPDKLIIYGIRHQTLQRIDKQIDGTVDFKAGEFQAVHGKNPETYTGILTL